MLECYNKELIIFVFSYLDIKFNIMILIKLLFNCELKLEDCNQIYYKGVVNVNWYSLMFECIKVIFLDINIIYELSGLEVLIS